MRIMKKFIMPLSIMLLVPLLPISSVFADETDESTVPVSDDSSGYEEQVSDDNYEADGEDSFDELAVSSTDIEINETIFPDSAFRSYVSSNYDTSGDGYLNEEEILNADRLECNSLGIYDLTGIEYFTELTVIDCSENPIGSIDTSNQTKLTELYLGYTGISSLDLTDNDQLRVLSCTSSSLTGLNVSGIESLEKLDCYYCTTMSTLDVSGCSGLAYIRIVGTALSVIDISSCPILVDICRVSAPVLYHSECYYALEDTGYIYYSENQIIETGINTDGWHQNSDGTRFYIINGERVTGWNEIILAEDISYQYYFDSNGIMQTGWVVDDGKPYYCDENGRMLSGWQVIDGKTYYLSPSITTGWIKWCSQHIDGEWIHSWSYFNANGVLSNDGWHKISGKWYYFDEAGIMQFGWQQISGEWYYLGDSSSGAMVTGWQKINNKWYYFRNSGVMTSGWQKINGKWYYINSDGSWNYHNSIYEIDGVCYYFDRNGVMKTGWVKYADNWYYFDANGAMHRGWLKYKTCWYYLEPGIGYMVVGTYIINGVTYNFDSNGICLNP